jgi:hypothetical protein
MWKYCPSLKKQIREQSLGAARQNDRREDKFTLFVIRNPPSTHFIDSEVFYSLLGGGFGYLKGKRQQTVAKIIQFHVPTNFRRPKKSVSDEQRGKMIKFVLRAKKSA